MAIQKNTLGDEAQMDRGLLRAGELDIYGADALHGLDPAEICMRMGEFSSVERVARERGALRAEIFSGFAEYLFADGPAPEAIRARIDGFFYSFHLDLWSRMAGERSWVAPERVGEVLSNLKYSLHLRSQRESASSRGALSTWSVALAGELDSECVGETLRALAEFLATEGCTWRGVVAAAYCLAKALRPHLIAGMSLHDIAILSGDSGGRATPSARIRRLYNRRLSAAGMMACQVHFQKSAAVVEKYAAAQEGNTNRVAKKRRHFPKTKTQKA